MSFKKTLIFLIILLLLGGYYYIVEVRIAEKKQAVEEAEKRLFQIKAEDIRGITLKRTAQEIVLKKQDDSWKMLQPMTASADTQNINTMLTQFVGAERGKTITEKSSNDEEFGLDKPELVFTAKAEEAGTSLHLSIGKETPTASGYYARVGDTQKIITVSTSLKTSLDKTMYDLRDKTILDFDPAQVKQAAFTIRDSEAGEIQEITLEQTDDLWKIIFPKTYHADNTKIGSLLSKVKSSKIKEFIEEKPGSLESYGLDQAHTILSLVIGGDNTQKTLLLGKTDDTKGGIYAKHEAAENVFLVPDDLVEQFPKALNDLRDKTLLAFTNKDIQKIELQSTDERVVLERSSVEETREDTPKEEWKITQPGSFKADNSKVLRLLSDARDMKVEQFVANEPTDLTLYGLETPQLVLSLWAKDQENPKKLLLGNSDEEDTGIYAKPGDQDSVVLVKSEALEQLTRTVFDLRYKKFLSFTQDQVTKIRIRYPETTLVLEKDGDVWNAKEPEKKDLQQYKVNNLMYDLEDLEFQADIVTPEEDLSGYGLKQPEIQVTLWEKKDEEVLTLLVGKKQEDEDVLYVKIAAENMVYAIEPSFLDELPKEINDLADP